MHPERSRIFGVGAALSAVLLCVAPLASAQGTGRGTISGKVTADQGTVVAFRVQAHNLDQQTLVHGIHQ